MYQKSTINSFRCILTTLCCCSRKTSSLAGYHSACISPSVPSATTPIVRRISLEDLDHLPSSQVPLSRKVGNTIVVKADCAREGGDCGSQAVQPFRPLSPSISASPYSNTSTHPHALQTTTSLAGAPLRDSEGLGTPHAEIQPQFSPLPPPRQYEPRIKGRRAMHVERTVVDRFCAAVQ